MQRQSVQDVPVDGSDEGIERFLRHFSTSAEPDHLPDFALSSSMILKDSSTVIASSTTFLPITT
ncbi:hypothetical protein HY642_02940 [Candidatus Woesearchaeota archaeon]|nr:hypothetical protein [Candidatus Woesearchaeota archaeon]